MASKPLKILIIRLSSIGDIVLTTPVIRCLKVQNPSVEIHYLVKQEFKQVLTANPHIHQLHELKSSIFETVKNLRKEQFDTVIDLHNNQRTLLIKTMLGIKSTSFYKENVEKWLMVNFKTNKLSSKSIVDRYFATLQSAGIENDHQGLEYFIPKEDEIDIKQALPDSFHAGYIGFVIGAKHYTKKFPDHKIIEVCKIINKPIVLLGGDEDQQSGDRIKLDAGKNIFNACGQFNINQSASLIRQADKIITNDTGLMHIAAAFKKSLISIWGNTIPEFGMWAYIGNDELDKAIICEVENLKCRPCSKIGFSKCPKGHFDCMEKIEIHKIVDLLNLLN